MKDFTLIIPVYKNKEEARALIDNIKKDDPSSLSKLVVIIDEDTIRFNWDKCEVVENKKRVGKATAINQGIELAETDAKVLLSSDIIIDVETIQKMVESLADNDLSVPRVKPKKVQGTAASLSKTIWNLHHYVSNSNIKAGEAIAFNEDYKLPNDTAVDEEYISSLSEDKIYLKDEIVYNRPPRSLKQLYIQRRRIFAGHLDLQRREHHISPTNNPLDLLRSIREYLNQDQSAQSDILLKACVLEFFARTEGLLRALTFNIPWKWQIVETED